MQLPKTNFAPPFNITRASHLTLLVSDLAKSKEFYTEIFGLIVSDETPDTVYLRGVEEICHHSLVLQKGDGRQFCRNIGLRVREDEDLVKAKAHFEQIGISADWVERPYQGKTLRFLDAVGTPIELCASMETRKRMLGQSRLHKGGAGLRLDHFQLHTPDPHKAANFYMALGFRISDYTIDRTSGKITGAFMSRKDNPHDVVYVAGKGPALHHFAYAIMESAAIFKACDVAGQLGYGASVERGPQRHGLEHMLYVYVRDPDGYRAELFIMPIQFIDMEETASEWDSVGSATPQPWGRPAPRSWFYETTPFEGAPQSPAPEGWDPYTLEKSLGLTQS